MRLSWEFLLRRPKRVLALVALSLLPTGWVASGLTLDSSYFALLPDDAPEVVESNEVRRLTGGSHPLIVAIDGADAETRLIFGRALAPRIEALAEVRWADIELPVDFLAERGLWLLDMGTLDGLATALDRAVSLVRRQQHPLGLDLDDEADLQARIDEAWREVDALAAIDGPLPDRVMTSRDGRFTFLWVAPTVRVMDMAGGRRLFEGIDRAVAELEPAAQGLTVRYAGKFVLVRDHHQVMQRDLQLASILALILCTLAVAAFARRPAAPFVIAAGVTAGVVWTMALASLLVGRLNIVTGLLVPVLNGLGVDCGIHLVMRYRQERVEHGDAVEAAARAVRGVLPPAFGGALTTAAAFLALTVSDLRGFSEFGGLAAIGIVLNVGSTLLVVPPILVLLDRRRAWRARPTLELATPTRAIPRRVAALVVALLGGFGIFGATVAADIPFRNDYRLLGTESGAGELFAWVDENIPFRFDPTVIVVNDVEAARRVEAVIERVRAEWVASPRGDRVDRVLSAANLVPEVTPERMARIEAVRESLSGRWLNRARGEARAAVADARAMADAAPWRLEDVPEALRRRLTTLDGQQVLVFLWSRDRLESDQQALAWAAQLDALRARLDAAGIDYRMSTESVMPAWVHRIITAEAPTLFVVAALSVGLLVLAQVRSLSRALVLCLPLAVGILGTLALMDLLALELNLFNLIALPCAIGIGIDDALHIGHRYYERGVGSAWWVLRRTGLAALLTSLNTALGFGSALVSHHGGLRSLGLLSIIAEAFTFLAALVFLPCLLTVLERRRTPEPA